MCVLTSSTISSWRDAAPSLDWAYPMVTILEVQTGDYLGEDDIVRFDDNYGRC